jgi:hypothetical protein
MLMVWALEKVLMEYDERLLTRILCTVQIPVMPGVPALDGDVSVIHQYDIEVSGINFLKALSIKHRHLPS